MTNGGRIGSRNVFGVDRFSGLWSLQEIADARRSGVVFPASGYTIEVLIDNPVAHWRLDETSGTTAADSSGNGNHGTYGTGVTLNQAPLVVAGRSIVATAPSTSDSAIDAPDIVVADAFSVELWVKSASAPAANRAIIGKFKTGITAAWIVWLNSSGTITVQLRYQDSTSGQVSVTSPASIVDGVRHQIVFAWDKAGDQKVHLYVDSVQVAESVAWDRTIWAGSEHRTKIYEVGAESLGFDEVSFYLSSLSAARIAAHYNAGIGA